MANGTFYVRENSQNTKNKCFANFRNCQIVLLTAAAGWRCSDAHFHLPHSCHKNQDTFIRTPTKQLNNRKTLKYKEIYSYILIHTYTYTCIHKQYKRTTSTSKNLHTFTYKLKKKFGMPKKINVPKSF